MNESKKLCKRRKFLQYAFASGTSIIAIGWLFTEPGSGKNKQDYDRSFSNLTSQQDPEGVIALDGAGNPIELSSFLANVPPQKPVAVKGLSEPIYLVVENGPQVAPYGIVPICTHRPHQLRWNSDLEQFVCPAHGARFDYRGRVTRDPAREDLKLIKVETQGDRIKLIYRR